MRAEFAGRKTKTMSLQTLKNSIKLKDTLGTNSIFHFDLATVARKNLLLRGRNLKQSRALRGRPSALTGWVREREREGERQAGRQAGRQADRDYNNNGNVTNNIHNSYNNSNSNGNMTNNNNSSRWGSSRLTAAGGLQQRSTGTCKTRKHRDSGEDTKLVTCINGT